MNNNNNNNRIDKLVGKCNKNIQSILSDDNLTDMHKYAFIQNEMEVTTNEIKKIMYTNSKNIGKFNIAGFKSTNH